MMKEQQLSLSSEFDYNPYLETDNLTDQWYTPLSIIEKVTRFYGGTIDLDPASCFEANRTVKAKRIFTEQENGLTKKWFGKIFCNPPYSTPLIGQFCEKVVSEYEEDNFNEAIYLIKEGATNAWFRPLRRFLTGYIDKRVKFVDGTTGKVCESPRSGHCLVYFGDRKESFVAEMEKENFCYFPNIYL
jgi:phage N-6-adenine-methyltransferase